MIEVVGTAILTKSIDFLVKKVFEGKFDKKILDKLKLRDAITAFTNNYLEQYAIVKVLGMSKPISIMSIYTGVNTTDNRFSHMFSNPNNLEESFRHSGLRGINQKVNKVDAIAVANRSRFLNVLGAPGAGKTTLLKRLGAEALTCVETSKYSHSLIPVYIELKSIESTFNIVEVLESYLSDFNFPQSENIIDVLLKEGSFLFLFDGFDECDQDLVNQISMSISKFSRKYKNNRFITSCRTAFYNNHFTAFEDVYLLDFDEAQIESFAKNWFYASGQTNEHERFIKLLKNEKLKGSYELARTPLLLTFLVLVYSKTMTFPNNRASLYRKALETLLHDWLAEKQVQIFDAFEGLHVDLEILMLASIAGPYYESNTIFFTGDDLANGISNFLKKELNAPKHLDARKIINVIAQKQGVLVERSHGIYSFSHLTIHEYLAAIYIKEFKESKKLLFNKADDSRWREVFLLLAGMGNSDYLLALLVEAADEKVKSSPKVRKVLDWIASQEYEGVPSKDDELARSGVLFDFLQNSWASKGGKPKLLKDCVKQLTSLEVSIIEADFEQSLPHRKPLTTSDKRNIIHDFTKEGLTREYLTPSWSNSDFESLIRYLKVYNRLFECKKASLSVSKEAWKLSRNSFLKKNQDLS